MHTHVGTHTHAYTCARAHTCSVSSASGQGSCCQQTGCHLPCPGGHIFLEPHLGGWGRWEVSGGPPSPWAWRGRLEPSTVPKPTATTMVKIFTSILQKRKLRFREAKCRAKPPMQDLCMPSLLEKSSGADVTLSSTAQATPVCLTSVVTEPSPPTTVEHAPIPCPPAPCLSLLL
jgi:hypothetical protein